jgi:8-amino-7-oxononanoate synthase
LIQFARPFIYTTAMSPMNALATREALKLVKQADDLRDQLQANIQRFREGAKQIGLSLLDSASPIQPVILHQADTALAWSEALKQKGFWVAAIRYPTVAKNQARLRITLSAAHSAEQIEDLLQVLKELMIINKLILLYVLLIIRPIPLRVLIELHKHYLWEYL